MMINQQNEFQAGPLETVREDEDEVLLIDDDAATEPPIARR